MNTINESEFIIIKSSTSETNNLNLICIWIDLYELIYIY